MTPETVIQIFFLTVFLGIPRKNVFYVKLLVAEPPSSHSTEFGS
jgi:hypothetical protein